MAWWVLAGCGALVGLVVDATEVAAIDPDALLVLDVVERGAVVFHLELDLAEATTHEEPELFDPALVYGFVAFADLDRDGVCQAAPVDLPWVFQVQTRRRGTFTWTPDPSESASMGEACEWFELGGEGDEAVGEDRAAR